MKKKTVVKNGVTYDFISEDQSIKFVCDICKKEKTSKKYAEYRDIGMHVIRICNACYGWKICQEDTPITDSGIVKLMVDGECKS